jgi:hypothetical protein
LDFEVEVVVFFLLLQYIFYVRRLHTTPYWVVLPVVRRRHSYLEAREVESARNIIY